MPTLGIETKVHLSTNNTRSSIEQFYRGIKVTDVVLRPYKVLENGSDEYDTSKTNAILFVSDEFEGVSPFDLTLVSTDIDIDTGENKKLTLTAVSLLILDVSNVNSVIVTNTTENPVGYRLIS